MARLLLAWELGGGLGHAGALAALAVELQRRGHRTDFALRDLVQTAPLFAGLAGERLQTPLWIFRTVGVPETPVSLAEVLLAQGYLRPEHLHAQLQGWLALLRLTGARAVVADYAPTAVLAARVLGLPCATLGTGFFIPPDLQPMPAFRADADDAGRVAAAEAQVLHTVNEALRLCGAAALPRLAPLLRGNLPLLTTWRELDHYQRPASASDTRWFGPSIGRQAPGDGGAATAWPRGDGPRAFAYLKASHPDHAAVLRALDAAGCRTLCYLPEVAAGKPPPVKSASIAYAAQAVDLRRHLPGCALLVCHAGTATLAQGLLAGVPLLLMPTQIEQYLVAERAVASGAALNSAAQPPPADYLSLVRRLIEEPSYGEHARAFARQHGGFDADAQTQSLADEIDALCSGFEPQ